MRGRRVGSLVTVRFTLAEPDADRASHLLRQALRRALRKTRPWRRVEIVEAVSLAQPDPLEMDPANPVSPLWREIREQRTRKSTRGGDA